jgi:hypothetical protein
VLDYAREELLAQSVAYTRVGTLEASITSAARL